MGDAPVPGYPLATSRFRGFWGSIIAAVPSAQFPANVRLNIGGREGHDPSEGPDLLVAETCISVSPRAVRSLGHMLNPLSALNIHFSPVLL